MTSNDLTSFGELLHMLRKREHLTQQQLADAVGVHRHAISRWEQGYVLPGSKALVLELVRSLHLDKEEGRQLLEASLTAVVPYWCVPYQRNSFFVGCRELLEQMHTILSGNPKNASTRLCALSGMGGIGKSQAAIEYAHLHALSYSAILWVRAQTEEDIVESFAAIAGVLRLSSQSIQTQDAMVTSVFGWFNTHRNWLLIFDDVQDIKLTKRYLPSTPNGSLLFTTRLPSLGTLAGCIELQPMSFEVSMHYLLRRAGLHPLYQSPAPMRREEEDAAQEITAAMGGLPLALEQIATYIEESSSSLAECLALFRHDPMRILRERSLSALYPCSVEKTFTQIFERLQTHNPVAAELLTICCFLAPEGIPEAMFTQGKSHLSPRLRLALSDPWQLNTLFKDLQAHALLRRSAQTGTISIHSIVQFVVKMQLSEETQLRWIELLIRMLDQVFLLEGDDEANGGPWIWREQLWPHAQRVFQLANRLKFVSPDYTSLLRKLAAHHFQRAYYEEANLYRGDPDADYSEHAFDSDHRSLAGSLQHLDVPHMTVQSSRLPVQALSGYEGAGVDEGLEG